MRVLLVDDDAVVRLTMSALLELAGHTVTEARSLAEARLQLAAAPFDLILLDLHLGDGLGTDLIPEVRQVAPTTRVALLSGSGTAADGAGADLVLEKGMNPDLLLARLER